VQFVFESHIRDTNRRELHGSSVPVPSNRRCSRCRPFAPIYSAFGACAEFAGDNYDGWIRFGRESIRQRPDFAAGYRQLTAAAAMAGDTELAGATLTTLRRVQPTFWLAWMASLMREKPRRACYLEAFRRAGAE